MKEIGTFLALQTPNEYLKFISTKFGLQDYEMNARSAITIDFYLETLAFSKEHGLNAEQTSTFFTIMKLTHEFALSNKSLVETYDYFKKLVLKHSLSGVEDCKPLFAAHNVKALTEHVSMGYMQHFRIYQYAFSEEQEKDQYSARLFVNTAFPVQPLSTFKNENEPKRPPSQVRFLKPRITHSIISVGMDRKREIRMKQLRPPKLSAKTIKISRRRCQII